jgi:hypothetical protein
MKLVAAGMLVLGLSGFTIAPALAQAKTAHAAANRVKVFAEPG